MSITLDEEFIELAEKALKFWGDEAQIGLMIEEAAELILVLAKRNRKENGATISEIISEMVDVEIMLAQMKVLFCRHKSIHYGWNHLREKKLRRLKARLKVAEETTPE